MSQIVAKLQSPFKQINPFVRFTDSFHPPYFIRVVKAVQDNEGKIAIEKNDPRSSGGYVLTKV